MSSFENVPIDWSHEYTEARKFMGQKDTDLDQLTGSVTMLMLNCPEKWVEPFQILIKEIATRKTFLETGLWILPR